MAESEPSSRAEDLPQCFIQVRAFVAPMAHKLLQQGRWRFETLKLVVLHMKAPELSHFVDAVEAIANAILTKRYSSKGKPGVSNITRKTQTSLLMEIRK
jgi:hypothetical protein